MRYWLGRHEKANESRMAASHGLRGPDTEFGVLSTRIRSLSARSPREAYAVYSDSVHPRQQDQSGRQAAAGFRRDKPDGYLLRKDFNAGVSVLQEVGSPTTCSSTNVNCVKRPVFVDQPPHQIFMLDHLAKPWVKENRLDPWRQRIRELARREKCVL
jgi:predicted TIM-barrel fold metal-dependent hydrolase